MPDARETIRRAVAGRLDEAAQLLCDLIAEPSVAGQEASAQELMAAACERIGLETSFEEVPESLRDDPEYSHADVEPPYEGRCNVVAVRTGTGGGRSLILSSHMDVVPAEEWPEAFTPARDGDSIVGRGAVDAKGQVVTAWLALAALQDAQIAVAGDVELQSVIEEEPGGNGALALLRQGHKADGAIVLEGTDLHVHPANRGALWFRLKTFGKPVHMGRMHEGISALDKMTVVIEQLREYGERLVRESRGVPQFERYERPVQLNVGTIKGGEWPSMVPGEVTIEGGVGFLPNKRMDDVKHELREAVESVDDQWLKHNYELDFSKLHNDAYATPADHPLPQTLARACRDLGLESEVFGWNISCDARLYYHVGGMPTVVFGPGSVAQAHSIGEGLNLGEMQRAAEALALCIVEWCGTAGR
ncbi:MAG: ArgE/DapE family deacylase [Armatimonadota bacterium]